MPGQRPCVRPAHVMPLEDFPEWKQQEIAEKVAQPKPPERWHYFGSPGDPYPLAAIHSRAWSEWYWQRGRQPETTRPKISPLVRGAVLARDGYICQLCFDEVEPSDVHLDHITPYSQGGPDTVENLQVTHSLCNISKGARV